MISIKRVAISEPAEASVPALVYPYRAGLAGGAIGGLAMIAAVIGYTILSGRGAWLLGLVSGLNVTMLIAGLLLHAVISTGLGFVFTLLLPTLPGSPIVWSLTIGSLLWWLAGTLALPLLNPILGGAIDAPTFLIAHLAYGLALGSWIAQTPKVEAE
jgi:hypothetical protein